MDPEGTVRLVGAILRGTPSLPEAACRGRHELYDDVVRKDPATRAPYDRIIVTVGAWDIPPAWSDQLAEGGWLVVPLRMRGLTRSIVFERDGGHLASRAYELCSFVPMQGAGERRERLACGSMTGSRSRPTVCRRLCPSRGCRHGRR